MVTGSKAEALGKALEKQGVKYLLPTYSDMHGRSKSKMVPISHFHRMMGVTSAPWAEFKSAVEKSLPRAQVTIAEPGSRIDAVTGEVTYEQPMVNAA